MRKIGIILCTLALSLSMTACREQTVAETHTSAQETEQMEGTMPDLTSTVENMEQYDTVFIGFPIWATTIPQPVAAFLEQYDFFGKTVIPFCTHAGYGSGNSYERIQELCPDAQVAEGLAIEAEVINDSETLIGEWLRSDCSQLWNFGGSSDAAASYRKGNEMEENDMTALTDLTILRQNDTYTVYELLFERGGQNIYGEFYLPGRPVGSATVIIGHGFGENYHSTADDAEAFAAAGIAAYVFDFCGGSPYSASDGAMTDMSALTEREDMETVLDGLKGCDFVERNNIFLMGESQGGFVAALLAARRAGDVRGLILFYPALVIPDDARARFASADAVPETSQVFGMTVGRNYYTDVLELDPFAEISGYTGNVLLVHGDRDSIVPISYSQRAAEMYPTAELVTIAGAGHGFYGKQLETACRAAVNYVIDNVSDS